MFMRYLFLFCLITSFLLPTANAALDLSVSAFAGGSDLRFDNVVGSESFSEEVRIRITSSDGKKYRVRHAILEQVVNERGVALEDEALTFYTIRGSNAHGTLYQDDVRVLLPSDTILYTSSQAGNTDSFIVVYTINGSKIRDSGRYQGRIIYTVEAVSGSDIQTVVTNINFNAQVGFNVKIESSLKSNKLSLDNDLDIQAQQYLNCFINSNIGEDANIYQRVSSVFRNEKGTILDERALKFFLSDAKSGQMQITSPQYVDTRESLIYSSPMGEPDEFKIYFIINEQVLEDVEAGRYVGTLTYRIKSWNVDKEINIPVVIKISEFFDLEVTAEEGLLFKNIKPARTPLPEERKIDIRVRTNVSRPYVITQVIDQMLTTSDGKTVPSEYFRFKQLIDKDSPGQVATKTFVPVEKENTILYVSDNQGTPVSFSVVYQLTPSLEVPAGNYGGKVTYSISEK